MNEYPGLPVYVISKVRENSPGALAGLQVEDQLISINRMNYKDLTLNDVNYFLQMKEGKKLKITVLRKGEKVKTVLELKDEL